MAITEYKYLEMHLEYLFDVVLKRAVADYMKAKKDPWGGCDKYLRDERLISDVYKQIKETALKLSVCKKDTVETDTKIVEEKCPNWYSSSIGTGSYQRGYQYCKIQPQYHNHIYCYGVKRNCTYDMRIRTGQIKEEIK